MIGAVNIALGIRINILLIYLVVELRDVVREIWHFLRGGRINLVVYLLQLVLLEVALHLFVEVLLFTQFLFDHLIVVGHSLDGAV